jgi:hypothetical protein
MAYAHRPVAKSSRATNRPVNRKCYFTLYAILATTAPTQVGWDEIRCNGAERRAERQSARSRERAPTNDADRLTRLSRMAGHSRRTIRGLQVRMGATLGASQSTAEADAREVSKIGCWLPASTQNSASPSLVLGVCPLSLPVATFCYCRDWGGGFEESYDTPHRTQ